MSPGQRHALRPSSHALSPSAPVFDGHVSPGTAADALRSICFAAHDVRSIDELSGRPTGRLGYIGPTTAQAIGGTAELALFDTL